jgi:hypothetical protein
MRLTELGRDAIPSGLGGIQIGGILIIQYCAPREA